MTGEEKKAIKIVKHFKELTRYWQEEEYEEKEIAGYIEIVLNLIEKQSKEIEELKEDKYGLEEEVQIQAKNLMLCEDAIKETYTKWIDKIKAKIEEWQKEKEFYNKDEDREWGQYNNWDWVDTIINEMQSLLEKE